MARPQSKKTEISAETSSEDVLVHTSELSESENIVNADKTKRQASYDPLFLIGDLARSSCKSVVWRDGIEPMFIKLSSIIKQLDHHPEYERGGFTLIKEITTDEIKDGKPVLNNKGKPKKVKTKVVEHWIVGDRALAHDSPTIIAEDKNDSKIANFHILLCGVISCIQRLDELSTGKGEKNRTLTINLTTLSIAHPAELKRELKTCKYIVKDGVKYRLNFTNNQHGYPEGYGAVFAGKNRFADATTLYVADLGAGTFQIAEYSLLGKNPQKSSPDSLHGGGGIQALKNEVFDALSNTDSSKGVAKSQASVILEASKWVNNTCLATDLENNPVGTAIQKAINTWLRDTIAGKAVERLSLISRKYPVVFCGGGFKIEAVREIIKKRIIESGGIEANLHFPQENIEILGVMGVYEHFLAPKQDTQQTQLQVITTEDKDNANDQQAA